MNSTNRFYQHGLYQPQFEHDACGLGFIVNIDNIAKPEIVRKGLQILENLEHRGATGSDILLGDGAGILTQIPHQFFCARAEEEGFDLPPPQHYAVGQVFLKKDRIERERSQALIEEAIKQEGLLFLGWRQVPQNPSSLSESGRIHEPIFMQVFIQKPALLSSDGFERKLLIVRKTISHLARRAGMKSVYIGSLSSRTIVYKGLFLSAQLSSYFPDLHDRDYSSALAMVHQRFSTNTFPSWELAHPFRMICHNGEINTLRGNFNWMRAVEKSVTSSLFGEELKKLWPLIYDGQSDSASFDNALELLVHGGYPLYQAIMMMVPEAWDGHIHMDPKVSAFYEYHAAMMEPWDGPAAIAFCDGRYIGATLDRNGLRPARYVITTEREVIMSSEAGVLDIEEEKILKKWRLQPGKMLLIDLENKKLVDDAEIKEQLSKARPYRKIIDACRIKLEDQEAGNISVELSDIKTQQKCFGYNEEDFKFILRPIMNNGEEATGSMGNDAALPVLSPKPKVFYHYFKQLFAQVTNPPIDPIREEMVMSLVSFLGPRPNLLEPYENHPPLRLEVQCPILSHAHMSRLFNIEKNHDLAIETFDVCFELAGGVTQAQKHLHQLCVSIENAIENGKKLVVLSDFGIDKNKVPLPMLLACSAVHQHLVKKGLRTRIGLIIQTDSAREVHHFALLAGFGAAAIYPRLALLSVAEMARLENKSAENAEKNFIKAMAKGLYKVMSKMGISTYQSYCGSQIFEAVGLNRAFLKQYFTGTPSQIEGIGFAEIIAESLAFHRSAFMPTMSGFDVGGEYAYRIEGEAHSWTPEAIAKLQHAVRANNPTTFSEFCEQVDQQAKQQARHLRDVLDFHFLPTAIDINSVESAQNIVKRFSTGAMSLGSISREAHTNLAIAMNSIGGKSNTGEGGEDPARYVPMADGRSMRSAIKQVASGRFGVTAEYLSQADVIQIKMAQGAKPGEGGQLPGHKVSPYIASLRFSVPGVGLISPPPHHDIYSIEDLAQLIFDLKNANSNAQISVKLVAEVGVGTVAAGVAKAHADHITISGHDGGTGASPISSIKHAGTPWELGLAETQQTLIANGLRSRVVVQVDGQLKTARDVVIGAMLGADEFGFATAPLIAQGCIMMRKCHLNTCPVGIATQDEELRKKFSGTPEHVINYFFFLAEEIRKLMAKLGICQFSDVIGRTDLLYRIEQGSDKIKSLDLSRLLYRDDTIANEDTRHSHHQNHHLDQVLDRRLIAAAQPVMHKAKKTTLATRISNRDRATGAMLSHAWVKHFGGKGTAENLFHCQFTGIAGQSFGAFLARGIRFTLNGQANDYVGKGLSGGDVIVRPPALSHLASQDNIIVGNTVLYGATSGQAFFSGVGGERFAVRNSGAHAVIEGVGDHGCEYMTGGVVVVLGKTGRNFAAGMSGGIAYVLDQEQQFSKYCNKAMVDIEALPSQAQDSAHLAQHNETELKALIEKHVSATESKWGQQILERWDHYRPLFVRVVPHEYRRVLQNASTGSV